MASQRTLFPKGASDEKNEGQSFAQTFKWGGTQRVYNSSISQGYDSEEIMEGLKIRRPVGKNMGVERVTCAKGAWRKMGIPGRSLGRG